MDFAPFPDSAAAPGRAHGVATGTDRLAGAPNTAGERHTHGEKHTRAPANIRGAFDAPGANGAGVVRAPIVPVADPAQRIQSRKAPIPVKIIVAGGFGVGKTTTVASISEIEPLTTEAEMTSVAAGIDDPGPTGKTTTTVAMDFGCVTIDDTLKLYLFGAPGQARFGFMWDDLARGALGALVIVDGARLDDAFAAVDYFERVDLPFAVGVNAFNGRLVYDLDTIRWALAIDDEVPVVAFDARDRLSVRDAVLVVLDRALARAMRTQAPM